MPKQLTAKDVLYALEYQRLELVGFNNSPNGAGGLRWALSDGTPVPRPVADEVRNNAALQAYHGADSRLRYFWPDAA